MNKEEMRKVRLNLVHQMHDYIMNTGDETIFETWFSACIPDAPCEEDFESFADDPEEFKAMCRIFGRLVCRDLQENY